MPKLTYAYKAYNQKADRLEQALDRAVARIGPSTTGYGALLASLPQTEARALAGDLDTIRANVGFDELQSMRDSSPTGGALGQVSEMENRLLQSVRAAIDQMQNGENLKQNLEVIRQIVRQIRALKGEQYQTDLSRSGGQANAPLAGSGPAQPQSADGWQDLGNGIRIREKK